MGTRRWRTRSRKMRRRRLLTSVMTQSSGWTPTNWLRWRSSRRSRRRSRQSATQSSPNCTRVQEALQEECQTWEVCQVAACQELEVQPQEVDLAQDQPLRRSTKKSINIVKFQSENSILLCYFFMCKILWHFIIIWHLKLKL